MLRNAPPDLDREAETRYKAYHADLLTAQDPKLHAGDGKDVSAYAGSYAAIARFGHADLRHFDFENVSHGLATLYVE